MQVVPTAEADSARVTGAAARGHYSPSLSGTESVSAGLLRPWTQPVAHNQSGVSAACHHMLLLLSDDE